MEPREILDGSVSKCFDQFCSKLRQKDSEIPSIIIQKASDVFNKLDGLKKTIELIFTLILKLQDKDVRQTIMLKKFTKELMMQPM